MLLILFGSGPGSSRPRSTSVRCSRSRRSGCCSRCSSPATSRGDGSCCGRFAASAIRDVRLPAGSTCRAATTCCRSSSASARRWCSSSSRRISARRSSSAASSSRCTPSRAAASAWPSPASLLLVAGFYSAIGCNISATLADRVQMWQSPWDNARRGGDQVAQAIWAMATGGIVRHRPRPRRHALSAGRAHRSRARRGRRGARRRRPRRRRGALRLIAWRGFRIGRLARQRLRLLPRDGAHAVPDRCRSLLMAAGVLGVMPLTGVVTPFLSYGGSAMVANFAALGLLAAIHADARPADDFEPFRVPLTLARRRARRLRARAARRRRCSVQVVQRRRLRRQAAPRRAGRRRAPLPIQPARARCRPHASRAARSSTAAACRWRPTIAQRSPARARRTRTLGVVDRRRVSAIRSSAAIRSAARAFHLLGDARTRANWSAPNTSYVERDAEDAAARLRRSRDDRRRRPIARASRCSRSAATTATGPAAAPSPRAGASGRRRVAEPAARRAADDRCASCSRASPRSSQATREGARARRPPSCSTPTPATLLASVSYPWPALADGAVSRRQTTTRTRCWIARDTACIRRARRSSWSPRGGAARDARPQRRTFTCGACPTAASARASGWSRPVRDDVLDTQPHGTIDMHDALVHSCNAYFAQLAVTLGPEPLLDAAGRLRHLADAGSNDRGRRVRDTLPQAGYGQGDVVATPLRMAASPRRSQRRRAARAVLWSRSGAAAATVDIGARPTPRGCSAATCATSCRAAPAAACAATRGDRRQDRHRGSRRAAVARLVRRLRAVRAATRRIAFAVIIEKRRLRRRHGGAGRRRDRQRRGRGGPDGAPAA